MGYVARSVVPPFKDGDEPPPPIEPETNWLFWLLVWFIVGFVVVSIAIATCRGPQ